MWKRNSPCTAFYRSLNLPVVTQKKWYSPSPTRLQVEDDKRRMKRELGVLRFWSPTTPDEMKRIGRKHILDTAGGQECRPFIKEILQLAKKGQPLEMEAVIKRMRIEDIEPNLQTWSTLIAGYAKNHLPKYALDAFQAIPSKPNAFCYNALLSALCKAGDLARALGFFEKMKADGLDPDRVTYGTLIHGCVIKKDVSWALKLWEEFEKGCQAGDIYVPPGDNTVFNTLLGCLADANDIKKMDELIVRHGEPDILTYTQYLKVLARAGETEKVIGIFKLIQDNGITPDTALYGVVLLALSNDKNGDPRTNSAHAVKLVAEMRKRKITRSSVIYVSLFTNLSKLGKNSSSQILEEYKHMQRDNIQPSRPIMSVLISYFEEIDRKEVADLMYRRSVELGFYACQEVYNDGIRRPDMHNLSRGVVHAALRYELQEFKKDAGRINHLDTIIVGKGTGVVMEEALNFFQNHCKPCIHAKMDPENSGQILIDRNELWSWRLASLDKGSAS